MSVFQKTAQRIAGGKPSAAKASTTRANEPAVEAVDDREAELSALRAQLEEQRRTIAARDAALAKYRKDAETYAQRATSLESELTGERVSRALHDASSKLGAHKPQELAEILRGRVQLVEGRIVAKDDPAKSYEDLVKDYLTENPHHVRAQVAAGSGAPPRAAATPAPPAQPSVDTRTGEGATNALRTSVLSLIPRKAG